MYIYHLERNKIVDKTSRSHLNANCKAKHNQDFSTKGHIPTSIWGKAKCK